MKYSKGISVVIPNYNGNLLLPEILPCLYEALKNSKVAYEVILVDDCSTDNTIAFLQNNYPAIILLQNETNKGFSPTINKGIFAAQYSLLLLLNSDVKLTPHYFDHLFPYFDNADTFGVMGRIIGWEDDKIQDGGKYPSMQGVKIKTSVNYIPKESKIGDRLYSMYLSGANALVNTEKIVKLGGFDELFAPFYIEDVELSIRAWRMGWKCYYEHNAVCKHKTSTTIKTKESKNFINTIYYRNKMFLHAIHLSGFKLFLWYFTLVPEVFIHLITARWYYFTSLKYFLRNSRGMRLSKNKFSSIGKKQYSLVQVFKDIKSNLFEKVIRL